MENIIAFRKLVKVDTEGRVEPFSIFISRPYRSEDGDESVEIYSEDVLFIGVKKCFGVDSIDALDSAIQMIDIYCNRDKDFIVSWPDNTLYSRVPVTFKMGWG